LFDDIVADENILYNNHGVAFLKPKEKRRQRSVKMRELTL
jgi:hypothetical protein